MKSTIEVIKINLNPQTLKYPTGRWIVCFVACCLVIFVNSVLMETVYAQGPIQYALLDIGEINQRVEPGAIELSGTGNGQNNNVFNGLTSDTGDTFDVTLTNIDQTGASVGGLDWRDRGTGSNAALVALAEDHIKNNGGVVRVTLSSLPAGTYRVTSYHVDASFNQSGDIQAHVNTGAGFVNTGVSGNSNFSFGGPGGLTTVGVENTQAQFQFIADGTNDVFIVFDGRPHSDDETPLSGLLIELIPPPSSYPYPCSGGWVG